MVVLLYTYILLLLLFIFVISCHRNLNLMFLVILVLGLGFSSDFEYWRKHDTDICFKIDTCQSFVSSCISYIQEGSLALSFNHGLTICIVSTISCPRKSTGVWMMSPEN